MPTVLVVDDHAPICKMPAALFENEGFSVLTASGAEALRIARACRGGFDLLLCDVDMPGMDGASLARQLRAEFPRLGIILMSGSWDPAPARLDMPARFVRRALWQNPAPTRAWRGPCAR